MIGPIFRAPKLVPRDSSDPPGIRRRVKNVITDMLEYCVAPFARWEKQQLVVERIDVAIRDLDPAFDGYRIVFLTDLHTSPLVPKWWLDQAVQVTLAEKPQLIAMGGDFLDDDPHFVPGLHEILKPLRAPDGVVGVLGNHDHYVDAAGVREQLRMAGVRELLNESLIIARGAARLAIVGVGDLERDVIDFPRAVQSAPENVPRIVLSHWPDVFAYWPQETRMDLMLSGHTHGGQAFLPFIGPPYVPSQFGFKYLRGMFHDGDRQLYVSRGVGASAVPFRWGSPPELTVVVLRTSHS